ncbi:aminotransferase class V-fold PLP-dependent enzyme, partial [Parabacteroides distasonis]
MKKVIYLDNAATTKTAPEVVDAMLPYFTELYGNASTIYELGGSSKKAMNEARETIADILGAQENEIYFTAGGSESDNWA